MSLFCSIRMILSEEKKKAMDKMKFLYYTKNVIKYDKGLSP